MISVWVPRFMVPDNFYISSFSIRGHLQNLNFKFKKFERSFR